MGGWQRQPGPQLREATRRRGPRPRRVGSPKRAVGGPAPFGGRGLAFHRNVPARPPTHRRSIFLDGETQIQRIKCVSSNVSFSPRHGICCMKRKCYVSSYVSPFVWHGICCSHFRNSESRFPFSESHISFVSFAFHVPRGRVSVWLHQCFPLAPIILGLHFPKTEWAFVSLTRISAWLPAREYWHPLC